MHSYKHTFTDGGITGRTQVSKSIKPMPTEKDAQDIFLDRYNALHVQRRNFTVSESSSKALYFHLIELGLDVASRNRIIKRS